MSDWGTLQVQTLNCNIFNTCSIDYQDLEEVTVTLLAYINIIMSGGIQSRYIQQQFYALIWQDIVDTVQVHTVVAINFCEAAELLT